MAKPIPTDLATLLLNLQARLMGSLGWPAERVIISARKRLPFHPHGDAYLQLRALDGAPVDEVNDASGRADNRCVRTVGAILRSRSLLDEATSDALWLTREGEGHYVLEHALFEALVDYCPTTDAGDQLTVAPLRWRKVEAADKDHEQDLREGWGVSTFVTEATFQLDLTVSVALL